MKVLGKGFNLYGQLIKPTNVVVDYVVIFESEVIKSFGINYSFSYFHTNDSFMIFPTASNKVTVDEKKIVTVASNDERIVVLYDNGILVRLNYDNEKLTINNVPLLLDRERSSDKIVNVSCGSKMTVFYSQEGKLLTLANKLKFEKNDIVQIECGREHCLLLDKAGNVYSFGRGR